MQGGPNFPHDPKQQLEFLKKRPNTNFYIMFEGEASFSNILDRILKYRKNKQELFDKPINGDNLPSKNLSNIPLRYGEGMSSRNLILSCVLRPLIKSLFLSG